LITLANVLLVSVTTQRFAFSGAEKQPIRSGRHDILEYRRDGIGHVCHARASLGVAQGERLWMAD
jgi:hypothetical protein